MENLETPQVLPRHQRPLGNHDTLLQQFDGAKPRLHFALFLCFGREQHFGGGILLLHLRARNSYQNISTSVGHSDIVEPWRIKLDTFGYQDIKKQHVPMIAMIVFCMLFLFSESWNWTMMLSWHPDHPPSSLHRPITSIQVSKLLYKRATLHTRPLTGPKGCVHGPRAFGTFPSDKSCRAPRATVLQPHTTSYAAATLNAPFCPNVAPSAHQEVHGSSNCQSSECHVYWSLVLKVYNARPMMRLQFATSFHEGMADLFLIHAHLENNTGTVKLDTARWHPLLSFRILAAMVPRWLSMPELSRPTSEAWPCLNHGHCRVIAIAMTCSAARASVSPCLDTTSLVHHWYETNINIINIIKVFDTKHQSNINQTSINLIYISNMHYQTSINIIIYHLYFWLTMTWWSTMVNSAKMPRTNWPPSGRGALGSVLKESRAARRSKSASMVLQALISSWTMTGGAIYKSSGI